MTSYERNGAMVMYEMKEEYFTGIEFIDQEHAKLFAIVNQAHELLVNQLLNDKFNFIK